MNDQELIKWWEELVEASDECNLRPPKGIELARELHLPGQHDQKTHGRPKGREWMRQIGKKGYKTTNAKIMRMINDPEADPDDAYRLAVWFGKRIKSTTVSYRRTWWNTFRGALREGANKEAARVIASGLVRGLKEGVG